MITGARNLLSTFILLLSGILGSVLLSYQIGLTADPETTSVVRILLVLSLAVSLTFVCIFWLSNRFFKPMRLLTQGMEDEVSKLKFAKDLVQNTVKSIHEAFFIIEISPPMDSQQRILKIRSLNPAAATLIGLPESSLLGSNLKIWLKTDYATIFKTLEEPASSTPTQSLQGVLKKTSGETIPLELSWARIPSDERNPIMVVIGRDISWKKEFEEQLHLKEILLKESQSLAKMGSFRWEITTGITLWTDEVFHILGFKPENTNPTYDLFYSMILPEDRKLFENAAQIARNGFRPLTIDLRMRKVGAPDPIWVRCHGRVDYDQLHNPLYIYGTIQDITVLKKSEIALIAAKDEAQKSSLAKSEFLAKMSHEIRTPMNAIMGMAELLKDTKLSDEQQYYISVFRRAGDSLMALINDILDLSKIEAGEVSIENIPFDLKKLITEVEEIMKPRTKEKGLSYSFEISPGIETSLIGDAFKLKQVLINLVNNSIKFTTSGSIRIQVGKNPTKKDSLMFSVTDTGTGIPEDKQHLIFQKFSQADSSITRRFGGTGLGLAISKSLVELMGGQIWFKSRDGLGTTFFFTTPYREFVPNKVTPIFSLAKNEDTIRFAKAPKLRDHKIRILVVDDTQDNRVLFNHFLKLQPFEIIEAQNGLEAVNKVKSSQFDIIFMDVQMPEVDGYAATNMIRKWEQEQHKPPTPIIALTAHALSEDRQKSLKAGCDDHIAKPFKRETLVNVINQYTM